MPILQLPIAELTGAGFSNPAQANSFYPAGDQDNHIHLGVPTSTNGKSAKPGNVFVTYVSFKVNDATLGRLTRCDSGYFDTNSAPAKTPPKFLSVLEGLDITVAGCG